MSRPTEALPDERDYTHDACGHTTTISGAGYLNALCNPFGTPPRTQCAHCGEAFGAAEFRWADTGERITDYHARYRNKVPGWALAVQSNQGCGTAVVGGLVVGVAGGLAVGFGLKLAGWLTAVAVAGLGFVGLIGGMIAYGTLSGSIREKFLGTSEWRGLV